MNDFNTSHVSINLSPTSFNLSLSMHFNTSHVSINRTCRPCTGLRHSYFNTSHVSINQCQGSAGASQVLISIHPMFLLINNPDADFTEPANFNTSHVSINPTSDPPPARHSSYFNTSHVSINLSFDEKVDEAKNISIHPMFLLIRLYAYSL